VTTKAQYFYEILFCPGTFWVLARAPTTSISYEIAVSRNGIWQPAFV